MKKIRTLTIILLTVMALLTSCLTNVSAANVCKNIGGTANYQTTFTIKTSNSWLSSKKVTLKQTAQGTAKGRGWTSYKTKYYKIWGYYNVYVTDSKGKTKTYTWTGKTLSISGLKKNSTYKVKVVPHDNGSYHTSYTCIINGGFYGWYKTPCWNVTKTSGITLCS